jgi:hypothetical protein
VINIDWEDENGNQIEEWGDYHLPWDVTLFSKYEKFEGTRCLQFIDMHGDTTFNRFQIPVLLDELEMLINVAEDPEEIKGIKSLLEFIRKRQDGIHIYLKFWGD